LIRRVKMRKISLFVIAIILAGIISFPTQVLGQSGSKVLLIPREGFSFDPDLMIKMEIGVMRVLLKNAGLAVDIATSTGISIWGPTEKVTDIKELRNIKIDDYSGVIIACMAVGGGAQPPSPASHEAMAIVKKALSDGKPVAANGNAPYVLAEAGVLKGKKYSYVQDPLKSTGIFPLTIPAFQDAIYSGSGLVQDGLIITSGICPSLAKYGGMEEDGTVKLTKAFIAAVKKK
jgi:putative intracellular protease/amidase